MCKNVMFGLVVACVLVVGSASGQVIFSDGFENHALGVMGASPASDVGDGWYDRWGTNSESVVDTVVLSGNKSLEVTRDHNKITSGFKFPARSYFTTAGYPKIGQELVLTWNINRLNDNSHTQVVVQTSGVKMMGWTTGVDFTNQNFYAQNFMGVMKDTGVAAAVGEWIKVVAVLNLVDVGGLVGGTYDLNVTQGGVTTSLVNDGALTAAASDNWLDIYIDARPCPVGTADNVVYFDDLLVEVVPEPATMALLGFGAMALLRKKA